MKRINKTNKAAEEKCTDFANTIYRIRTERDITQQELADLIGVSNRTISKWEQGTTVPDLETIKRLCKELGISPGAIVKSERNFRDYHYIIKKNITDIFKYIIKNIFLIGFVVAFMVLLMYFVNNFNTIKIYNITYSDENISFESGYFFKTKIVNVITISNIKLDKIKYEPVSTKVELYTYLNGDKYVIYTGDTLNNILIDERKSYADLLTKDVIKSIKNNLYIKIDTKDEDNNSYSYESKLVLKPKLSNDKLAYIDYFDEKDKEKEDLNLQNPFLVSLSRNCTNFDTARVSLKEENIGDNVNKLASLGYTYNEETDTYTKIDDDGGVIEYSPEMKIIIKEKIEDNIKYKVVYENDGNSILYNIVKDNRDLIVKYVYYSDSKTLICYVGDCKNYKNEITYILSVYKEINDILL